MLKKTWSVVSGVMLSSLAVASAADGIFVRSELNSVPTNIQGSNLSLNVKLVPTEVPKANGIFLYDALDGSEHRYVLHVALEKRPATSWRPVIVLGDTTVMEPEIDQLVGGYPAFIKFGANDPTKAEALLKRLGRVFNVNENRVRDLRLPNWDTEPEIVLDGNLTPEDVREIHAVVSHQGRHQTISSFCGTTNPDQQRLVLNRWPRKGPMRIMASRYPAKRSIGVYYAANAGFQLEKREGRWTIVGG